MGPGIIMGNTLPPPVVAERDNTLGEMENGLVSSTGLVDVLLLAELLLSSSMVKLVLGEGELRFGESDGERRDVKPDEVGDTAG